VSLLALLNQTVTVEEKTGTDGYNKPTYAAPATYPARVQKKQKLVRSRDGSEKVATAAVWLPPTAVVSTSSRLTLTDGSNPPILAVEEMPDGEGRPFYLKLWCE
jgi:hypothetical protein